MQLVFKYRIKGQRFRRVLERQARAVNFVWNVCNDAQRHAVRWSRKWLTGYDLNALTDGASKELGLGAQTIQAIGQQYASSRAAQRKAHLRYRGKRSPGWVPFKASGIRMAGPCSFKFMGQEFGVWMSRPLGGPIKCGSFTKDALGHWYVNICCDVPLQPSAPTGAIGIDLGIKTVAAMSDGTKHEGDSPFRAIEPKLAIAQRARKNRAAAVLHAKAKNRRKDAIHKLSTRLVQQNALVVVGNVSSQAMVKTRLAKGALDAGWGMFRNFLSYKRMRAGITCEDVDEYNSTRTCSECGSIPASAPKGLSALGIRAWKCSDCGASHDRDTNAARNILMVALGGQRPAEGIPVL